MRFIGHSARTLVRKFPRVRRVYWAARFSLTKGRLKALFHYLLNGHLFRYAKIRSFFSSEGKYLQVGGGRHLIRKRSWINGDLIGGDIYLNATKKIPFPSGSLDGIFAEQFIEHLELVEAESFLRECHRVLKPGGVVRLATPDLEGLIEVYLGSNTRVPRKLALARHRRNHRPELTHAALSPAQFLNDYFRLWGHRFIFDEYSLSRLSSKVGFGEFLRLSFGESPSTDLSSLERHADVSWMKDAYQIVAELRKGGS